MRTPAFLPPFDYALDPFFKSWPARPVGAAAIAIIVRLDNVTLAHAASDAGRPALDPIQEELRDALSGTALADPQFLRFLGNFERRVMEHTGYELVEASSPLPLARQIILQSAATYRRVLAAAA